MLLMYKYAVYNCLAELYKAFPGKDIIRMGVCIALKPVYIYIAHLALLVPVQVYMLSVP